MPRGAGFGALIIGLLVGYCSSAPWPGLHRRPPQDLARCARGDHDDHAQQHRRRNHLVDGHHWSGGLQEHQPDPDDRPDRQGGLMPTIAGIPSASSAALGDLCGWDAQPHDVGFRFDTVGKNKLTAGYAGILINRVILLRWCSPRARGLGRRHGGARRRCTASSRPSVAPWASDGITIALLRPVQPGLDDPGRLPGRHPAHQRRPAVRHRHRARDRRPIPANNRLLLANPIPVLVRWIFRAGLTRSAAATSWGTDMARGIQRNKVLGPHQAVVRPVRTSTTSPTGRPPCRYRYAWTYAVPLRALAPRRVTGERSGVVNIGIEGPARSSPPSPAFRRGPAPHRRHPSPAGCGLILGGGFPRPDDSQSGGWTRHRRCRPHIVATGITSFYYKPGSCCPP